MKIRAPITFVASLRRDSWKGPQRCLRQRANFQGKRAVDEEWRIPDFIPRELCDQRMGLGVNPLL